MIVFVKKANVKCRSWEAGKFMNSVIGLLTGLGFRI